MDVAHEIVVLNEI